MAAEGFGQAAVLLPENGETHFNLGVALEKTGRPEEAVQAYRRSASLGDARAYFNLGQLLESRGRPGDAVAAYRAFLKRWKGAPQVPAEARRRILLLERK